MATQKKCSYGKAAGSQELRRLKRWPPVADEDQEFLHELATILSQMTTTTHPEHVADARVVTRFCMDIPAPTSARNRALPKVEGYRLLSNYVYNLMWLQKKMERREHCSSFRCCAV
jgi:hypothetical protein